MIIIIPKCPNCKVEGKTVLASTEDKKTWFSITFCPSCFSILECSFRGTTDKKLTKAFLKAESKTGEMKFEEFVKRIVDNHEMRIQALEKELGFRKKQGEKM